MEEDLADKENFNECSVHLFIGSKLVQTDSIVI